MRVRSSAETGWAGRGSLPPFPAKELHRPTWQPRHTHATVPHDTTPTQLDKMTHATPAHTTHITTTGDAHVKPLTHTKTAATNTITATQAHAPPAYTPQRHPRQNTHTHTVTVTDIDTQTDTQPHTDVCNTHTDSVPYRSKDTQSEIRDRYTLHRHTVTHQGS